MVLVPKKSVERSRGIFPNASAERLQGVLEKTILRSVQTPDTVTSPLDAEINDALNSLIGSDETEMWSRYLQVLERYLRESRAIYQKVSLSTDS